MHGTGIGMNKSVVLTAAILAHPAEAPTAAADDTLTWTEITLYTLLG
jgi:hypothetical protein